VLLPFYMIKYWNYLQHISVITCEWIQNVHTSIFKLLLTMISQYSIEQICWRSYCFEDMRGQKETSLGVYRWPSLCKLSYFWHLLKVHGANFSQTCPKGSLGGPLCKLCLNGLQPSNMAVLKIEIHVQTFDSFFEATGSILTKHDF